MESGFLGFFLYCCIHNKIILKMIGDILSVYPFVLAVLLGYGLDVLY